MWWCAFNNSTYKVEVGDKAQDHPQLYKHCESSLVYMSPSQTPKYNKKKKKKKFYNTKTKIYYNTFKGKN